MYLIKIEFIILLTIKLIKVYGVAMIITFEPFSNLALPNPIDGIDSKSAQRHNAL